MGDAPVYSPDMPKLASEASYPRGENAPPGPMVEFIEKKCESNAAFAEMVDESRQTITNWKARGIPFHALPKVAKAMGITFEEYMAFAHGGGLMVREAPAPADRYVMVPAYASLVGLGPGRFNEQHLEVAGEYAYSASWIRAQGWRPEDLGVTFGEGESMEDTIHHGDRLLVHFAENDPKRIVSGKIYAIEDANNGTRVKRLIRLLDGRLLVRSDNNRTGRYPDEYLTPESGARIIGRVVDRSGPL